MRKSRTDECICGCRPCKKLSYKKITNWDPHLSKFSPNHMVFKSTIHGRNFDLWFRICCDENSSRDDRLTTI
jgi:hypothetical protein